LKWLQENIGAVQVEMTDNDLKEISGILAAMPGTRYAEQGMKLVGR
jgi:hypothetical protein